MEKGEWITYSRGDFWREVEKYAGLFSQLPIGEKVLFIKNADLALLAAFIGAIKAGVVPAQVSPLSKKTSEEEYHRKIDHIISLTHMSAIFCDEDCGTQFDSVAKVFTPKSEKFIFSTSKSDPGRDAVVQFSSGSTGLQKGVLLTHSAILSHMEIYADTIKLSDNDRLLSWLPLYHDMGLIACYLMPLMCGVEFSLIDPFAWVMSPDVFLKAIEEQKYTICFLPNFSYHVLVRKGKVRDLSSIRLFVNCSEPVQQRTHDEYVRRFPTVKPTSLSVCYALAENTFAVSQTPLNSIPKSMRIEGVDVISCGQILSTTQVRIFDKNEYGVGEVGVKGESLFKIYLEGEFSSIDGYYLTGDLGYLRDDGELFITGRKKDVIIVSGKNLYPQDIEFVCSFLPGVYPGRVVAFGILNEVLGTEELYVIVETTQEFEDDTVRGAVLKAVREEVGIVPKRALVVNHMSLVKTSSGKISRARNRELYISGAFS